MNRSLVVSLVVWLQDAKTNQHRKPRLEFERITYTTRTQRHSPRAPARYTKQTVSVTLHRPSAPYITTLPPSCPSAHHAADDGGTDGVRSWLCM